MLRIRLQRKGRKKRPIWHIVVADSRSPRDGRIIEQVGRYDNVTEKKEVILNEDRIFYWLDSGAQPSDTVRKILRREGLLYKRHLMNWGKSEEEIEEALAEWKEYRDSKFDEKTTRKEQYEDVLKAEEKEYKKKVQEEAAKAAAEVKAEKAAGELGAEDDAPKTEAEEIEEALEDAESDDSAEASVEETAEAEQEAADDSQEDVEAEEPVAEAEENEEVAEEETTAEDDVQPEEADAKEAAEAVEENVAEATEEPDTEEAAETEEEDSEEETEAKEEKEEAAGDENEDQVSTDMTAKEAIDHINDTELAELEGFVPDDEDRVTVQRAWESKQEEG